MQRFGIKGYYNGLMIRLTRRTLVTSMSWTVYEKVIHYRIELETIFRDIYNIFFHVTDKYLRQDAIVNYEKSVL